MAKSLHNVDDSLSKDDQNTLEQDDYFSSSWQDSPLKSIGHLKGVEGFHESEAGEYGQTVDESTELLEHENNELGVSATGDEATFHSLIDNEGERDSPNDRRRWIIQRGLSEGSESVAYDQSPSKSEETLLPVKKTLMISESFASNHDLSTSQSNNDFNHRDPSKASFRLCQTSDYYSLSSCNSSHKSDTINGNVADSNFDSAPSRSHHKKSEDQRSTDGSYVTLFQRENSDLTVSSQPPPTTPTGSCLKGSHKSSGSIHVQFETPYNVKDKFATKEALVLENGNNNSSQNRTESTSKFWSRLHSDSCENTPFSSLKKSRKKRTRQPSGSSTTSIGSSSTSTSESRTTEFERRAPDGGWGWVVVFASFMVHCIADGVTMSFGVLYVEFLSYFEESKSLTSWIGSLFMAIPLLAGPLASLLTDRYGCRSVTIWGAVISCIGFLASSFANSILLLFITVGVVTGLGLAVCYVAAIVIVAFYFEKYRSLATGIAVAGSGIGTFMFAPIIQHLLENFGWRGCLIILAGIFLNMAVCGALMRDLAWTKRRPERPSSANTSSTSRQCSVTHSSDTLGARGGGVAASTTLPSLEELRRLVQSGEIASLLSSDEIRSNVTRSESLILLPTFLNTVVLPKDLLPCLSSKTNAYELVSYIYPHLLTRSLSRTLSQSDLISKDLSKEAKAKCLRAQISLQKDEEHFRFKFGSKSFDNDEGHEKKSLIEELAPKGSCSSLPWEAREFGSSKFLSPKKASKIVPKQGVPARITSSCIGGASSSPTTPAAPLRDMRVPRQSMTFRGAMLNINRYRLRASSCPNIYRNSIITIAETENQNDWSYLDDFGEMLTSCVDLNHCLDASYLIFALSNFILYVFYDTVYLYLTDYALDVGISAEDGANLISAIGILNCVGMVFMGYIGDHTWSSPMIIYNVSMVACGLSVIAMPFITNYWALAAASAVFGLFISANYALTAVILVELISLEAFSKSYGLLLLIQGIANLIGPPLVGFMADATGSYVIPFVVSGIFIVLCGLMLALIPLIRRCQAKYSHNSSPASSPQRTSHYNKENTPSPVIV